MLEIKVVLMNGKRREERLRRPWARGTGNVEVFFEEFLSQG